jgi:seryl-tRNA(Sec) selenium transferase
MTNVYEAIGAKPIINATGVFTRLGGVLTPPEVTQAMSEAAKQGVCMEELQHRTGQVIAQLT